MKVIPLLLLEKIGAFRPNSDVYSMKRWWELLGDFPISRGPPGAGIPSSIRVWSRFISTFRYLSFCRTKSRIGILL